MLLRTGLATILITALISCKTAQKSGSDLADAGGKGCPIQTDTKRDLDQKIAESYLRLVDALRKGTFGEGGDLENFAKTLVVAIMTDSADVSALEKAVEDSGGKLTWASVTSELLTKGSSNGYALGMPVADATLRIAKIIAGGDAATAEGTIKAIAELAALDVTSGGNKLVFADVAREAVSKVAGASALQITGAQNAIDYMNGKTVKVDRVVPGSEETMRIAVAVQNVANPTANCGNACATLNKDASGKTANLTSFFAADAMANLGSKTQLNPEELKIVTGAETVFSRASSMAGVQKSFTDLAGKYNAAKASAAAAGGASVVRAKYNGDFKKVSTEAGLKASAGAIRAVSNM